MLGIKNYNPVFYNNIDDISENHLFRLRGLIGKKISAIYTVHDCDEELWNDCPIILNIEDCQLEMCVFKDNEVAITWNEINLSEKLEWYGSKEIILDWKKNIFSEISKQFGKPIEDIEIIEYLLETYDGSTKKLFSSKWALNGLGFKFRDGYFEIYNCLDGYSVSDKKIFKKCRFTSVFK